MAAAPEEKPEITHSPVTALAIGLVAGVGSALLGIGGGLVMVPGMVYMLRVRQRRAIGTSLAVILPTAIVAVAGYHQEAIAHHQPGLNLWVVLWLAVGGVLGAIGGAILANRLNSKQLRGTFGCFVAVTGAYMIYRAVTQPLTPPPVAPVDLLHAVELVVTGVVVGIVSGLLGVGGGLVMVPALALGMGFSQHQAQATSLAVIIPVSLSAIRIHLPAGNIIGTLALPMAVGAVLGAWVTSLNVHQITDGNLKLIFGGFLFLVGCSMIYSRPARKTPALEPAASEPPPAEPGSS